MKQAGSLLMLVGVVTALFAFMMDTTVSSSGTFIAGSYIGGGSTYNLGLLQQQMMIFQSGLASFVAGAFLYGSGERGETRPGGTPSRRSWSDVQEDETEEERDERVGRARRRDMIILAVVAALIIFLVIVVNWPTGSSDQNSYMNVDENLTTTDMNADENLTATDLNAP